MASLREFGDVLRTDLILDLDTFRDKNRTHEFIMDYVENVPIYAKSVGNS
jgi:hypothetical protein